MMKYGRYTVIMIDFRRTPAVKLIDEKVKEKDVRWRRWLMTSRRPGGHFVVGCGMSGLTCDQTIAGCHRDSLVHSPTGGAASVTSCFWLSLPRTSTVNTRSLTGQGCRHILADTARWSSVHWLMLALRRGQWINIYPTLGLMFRVC